MLSEKRFIWVVLLALLSSPVAWASDNDGIVLSSGDLAARAGCICGWNEDQSAAILRIRGTSNGNETVQVEVRLPGISETTLFLLVKFGIFSNESIDSGEAQTHYDGETERIGNGVILETWIAASSNVLVELSPTLYDALTLGSLSVAARSNDSLVLLLPSPVCEEGKERVNRRILASVLKNSNIPSHSKWTLEALDVATSLQSSQVFLFMSVGLLSVFWTFITLPFLTLILYCKCCRKINIIAGNNTLGITFQALYIVSAFLFPTFLIYWAWVALYYYTEDTIAGVLFPEQMLSPFTVNLIFYSLTGFTSFLGGLFFSTWSLGSAQNTCNRLGFGLFSVVLSAFVYHLFFVILAVFEDVVTVLSSLFVFGTVLILLFLSSASVICQYKKTGFKGFFSLVVSLKMIILVLYIVSVKAFGNLVLQDCYIATVAWLIIVTMLSFLVISFSFSVFCLILRQNSGRDEGISGNQDAERGQAKVLVPRKPLLASVGQLEMVMLIPSVLNTWRGRKESSGGKKKSGREANIPAEEKK